MILNLPIIGMFTSDKEEGFDYKKCSKCTSFKYSFKMRKNRKEFYFIDCVECGIVQCIINGCVERCRNFVLSKSKNIDETKVIDNVNTGDDEDDEI